MRTPAGSECKFFFGDYYRGKQREECRLIGEVQKPRHWTSDLCKTCPVPGIQRANACEFMELSGHVSPGFLFVKRRVKISAFCHKSNQVVDKPHIGCDSCHPLVIKIGKPE
jgi:hypothetical protein